MNIKDLLREDDAVSPVIGVILMVAITVILAAVIGTFVLGLGDQVQSSAPNANFQFEYGDVVVEDDDGVDDDVTITELTISHNGGQDVDAGNIQILIDGNIGYGVADNDATDGAEEATVPFASGTISTGTSDTVAFYDTDGPDNSNDYAASPSALENDGSGLLNDAAAMTGGEEVRVVWTSPNGDSSNTIGQSTVPN